MISVDGKNKNLECADCRSSFSYASLLLRHFAEHISGKNTEKLQSNDANISVTPCKNKTVLLHEKGKKKTNGSILEVVLKQSMVVQNVNDSKSPMIQEFGSHSVPSFDSLSKSKRNHTRSEFDVPNKLVFEIGERAKEKIKSCTQTSLMKFDLQKRLENCVSRLIQKQCDIKSANLNNSGGHSSHQYYRTNKTYPKIFDVKKNCEDDFNPLKLCVVTLEENEEKVGICGLCTETADNGYSTNVRSSKGASNRKQQTPKKIHRPLEESANNESSKSFCNVSLTDEEIDDKRSASKRRYMCQVCSKAFGWSTDLKRHILTHTGERPFKCQRCSATFTRNFLLQKHERRTHHSDIQIGKNGKG